MLADKKSSGGQGLYFLSATITSPTLARAVEEGAGGVSEGEVGSVRPGEPRLSLRGFEGAFGDYADAQYKLDVADVIVSLDADFLSGAAYPGFHKLAQDYAKRRRLEGAKSGDFSMNRLYAVESMTTTTGMKAEHRLALRASEIPAFAAALAAAGGRRVAKLRAATHWIERAAEVPGICGCKDLKANGGKSVVIPGEQQPAVGAPGGDRHQPGAGQCGQDGDLSRRR